MTQAGSSWRSALPRDPRAVALARRTVEQYAGELSDDELDVARLLVSELVTNAVRHGDGEIVLALHVDGAHARFEVHDDGDRRPRRRALLDADADGGFGLNLIETLAPRWGVDERTGAVWFELDRATAPPARAAGAADAPATARAEAPSGGAPDPIGAPARAADPAGPLEAARSALAPARWSTWSAIGATLAIALTALDVAIGETAILTAALVLPPLTCALLGRWGDTGLVAAFSLALALVGAAWNGGVGNSELVALIVVGLGGTLAVLVALLRAAAEVNLSRFRLLSAVADVGNEATALDDAVARLLDILTPTFADVAMLDAVLDGSVRRLGIRPLGTDTTALEAELRSRPSKAAIFVPLRGRGQAIGTLSTLLGGSGRSYSRSDVAFAEVFAGRAAVVLDNAGLTSELDTVARRLDAVLDGLAEAVTVMDADGRAVYANEAAVALLRLDSARDLLDADPGVTMQRFAVYDEDGEPVALERLPGFRALAGEPDPEPLLVRNIVKETGEERWLLTKTTTITDADGRITGVANVIEDVTEAKRAELAQRLLAEAGDALASSLDYGQTLQRVAEVAVPSLADWCGVDLPGSGGLVQSVAVAHVDPEKVAMAHRLRSRYPVRLDEPEGLALVIRGGPSLVVGDIPDADLVAYARDEEHLEMLREAGMASVMIVPLAAGGQTLGALTLARTTPGRTFDAIDIELAEEIGRRAGTAVLNARLYTERSAIAATLQRGLQPPELRAMPGFEAASLYRAAGELNEVGGDFYDAFATDDGWMLVIGDVAGQGAEAATLTGLARYTLRSVGQLTGDPARAARQLNATLRDRTQLSLCTTVCVHLRMSGDGAVATLANCGHPHPLLLREGELRELGEPGPMAGAFDDGDWSCEHVDLRPGDTLVLYTDGVLDTAGAEERFGEARLQAALRAAPSRKPRALVDHLAATLDAFQRGGQRDDTAIVALRFLGPA